MQAKGQRSTTSTSQELQIVIYNGKIRAP